jgi:hypothetical protein
MANKKALVWVSGMIGVSVVFSFITSHQVTSILQGICTYGLREIDDLKILVKHVGGVTFLTNRIRLSVVLLW